MKKENVFILAGALGFLAVSGLFGFRLFLHKKSADYDRFYSDYHQNLPPNDSFDETHGIEYL